MTSKQQRKEELIMAMPRTSPKMTIGVRKSTNHTKKIKYTLLKARYLGTEYQEEISNEE